jgi:hypothetical protein
MKVYPPILGDSPDQSHQPSKPSARARKSPFPRAAKHHIFSINSCLQNVSIDVDFSQMAINEHQFFAEKHNFPKNIMQFSDSMNVTAS